MKIKNITLFILCFLGSLFACSLSAQEYKSFNLNKYYTPDIVRNQLDLTFDANGGVSNNKTNYSNSPGSNDTLRLNNLSGRLNSSFVTFKNTRKRESSLQLNLSLQGQFNNKNHDESGNLSFSKDHYSSSSELIGLNYTSKFYNPSYQFISVGVYSSLNFEANNTRYELPGSTTQSDGRISNAQINPFIGIGVGRIESVKDARQAIYILDDLSKRGVLTRHLSDDEIFKLAQEISRVKNKRFLDARLHKIDEISAVDSFFVRNDLLTKSDATYFTMLYDNWENGANFERNSGHFFEVRLSPFLGCNYVKNDKTVSEPSSNAWQKQNDQYYNTTLAFNYNYAKQINQDWEKTANASLYGIIGHRNDKYSSDILNELTDKINSSSIGLTGSYGLGYYPNTRTHLSAALTQNFTQYFFKNTITDIFQKAFSSDTFLGFSAVYYVSQQLSVSGDASFENHYIKNTFSSFNQRHNDLEFVFSAKIKYSFF
jgi:hypothetical protein